MASEADHLACANRTQKTIEHLLTDRAVHSPWIAVAAFYKGLHVIEAVLATKGVHGASHEDRDRILRGERRYENIYRQYSQLKRASINARYLSDCSAFDSYLTPDQVVQKLLQHHLVQLEKSAARFLTPGNALVPISDLFK
jgi:hypothetical protein